MGSLPDSKYIIKTDGYWFVEAHDVDSSKGYITVSAKGIANGLSNEPNDGADFGPDSYNPDYTGSGIPYTQTSGIQEAVNYGNNILLLEGAFFIDIPISLPKGVQITGTGYGNTKSDIYQGLYPPFTASTAAPGTWIIANKSMSSVITSNGNLPTNNAIKKLRIEGNYLASTTLDLNAGTEYPNDAISQLQLVDLVVANGTAKNIDISHNADAIYQNIHTWTYDTNGNFVLGVYDIVAESPSSEVDFSYIFSYSPSGLQLNVQTWHCSHSVVNTLNIAGNGMYFFDSGYLANSFQNVLSTGRIVFQGNYTAYELSITNSYVYFNSGVTTLLDFDSNSTASVEIFSLANTVVQTTSATAYFYNNGTLSQIKSINDTGFTLKNIGAWDNNPYALATPTVPTSGTAQQNTNPYPVNVYLYGGTVTVIDYTPSGGSATQVGTSGPATVRLNPGDSITLTYSGTPTWNWVAV